MTTKVIKNNQAVNTQEYYNGVKHLTEISDGRLH